MVFYLCSMFVRTKTTPNSEKTAVQLVSNERIGKKVKQKIIRHFGYGFTPEEIEALKNLANKHKQMLLEERQPSLFGPKSLMDTVTEAADKDSAINQQEDPMNVNLQHFVEKSRVKVGVHQVYGSLFDQLGLHRCIKSYNQRQAAVKLMRDVVLARIGKPQSKRASVRALEDDFGITHNLTSVYRMMDYLDDQAIDKLKTMVSDHTRQLIGEKVDIVFYDCTSLYFESFELDELKQKGFSKDGKHSESQLILALAVTRQGLPIDYEVFPGNTFEGHTVEKILENLSKRHQIDQVMFVADAAMLNSANCELLQKRNIDYIVGARIKNMNQSITQQILDSQAYQSLKESSQEPETSYQKIQINDSQYLYVTYSPKRARKDEHDRQKAIEKLRKRYNKPKSASSLIKAKGTAKYLRVDGQSKVVLDEEKIQQAAKWDGLHGVITNNPNMDPKQIIEQYRGLWQVEETFRISKNDMKMRPIFHWTPGRIKAHIALCYMALCCIRTLEYRVRIQYKKLSPKEILYHISRLEASVWLDQSTKKEYLMPSQASQHAKKIYDCLGLRWRSTPYKLP